MITNNRPVGATATGSFVAGTGDDMVDTSCQIQDGQSCRPPMLDESQNVFVVIYFEKPLHVGLCMFMQFRIHHFTSECFFFQRNGCAQSSYKLGYMGVSQWRGPQNHPEIAYLRWSLGDFGRPSIWETPISAYYTEKSAISLCESMLFVLPPIYHRCENQDFTSTERLVFCFTSRPTPKLVAFSVTLQWLD